MPFAPAAIDRSGEIMAQGIMRAGGSITDAIEKHKAEGKKLKAYRAMAVDGLGLDPEEVDQMDLPTLEGKMQSLAVKNVMGQMQAREEARKRAELDQAWKDKDRIAKEQGDAELPAMLAFMGDLQNKRVSTPEDIGAYFESTSSEMPTMPATGQLTGAQVMGQAATRFPNAARSMDRNQLVRFMGLGDDPLGKFNAETARMNAENGRRAVEERAKGGARTNDRFNIRPVQDFMGRVTGYGVNASFDTEEEAQAFVEKQNKAMSGDPGDVDAELKLAQDAIAAGTPRDKVAKKYKERTGKELPK